MSIRQDISQWLIYQEDIVPDVVGALEMFLMDVGAFAFLKHPDEDMRAIGHAGARIAATRLAHWKGELRNLEATELQETLAEYLDDITAWLAHEGARPDEALDDIRAALVWIDKRAVAAGVVGDGWYREIVRESTIAR